MNRRQMEILAVINRSGHGMVSELAEQFAVTEMTIRRDLKLLEKSGKVSRIHGGAVPSSTLPLGTDVLIAPATREQIVIAEQVVKHIPPGSTVMLNVGTTVLQVAREIARCQLELTVVTNSLPVAITLYQSECHVLLTGGCLRRQSLDLTGPVTEQNIDEYHVDMLIAGCDGAVADEGFFTKDVNLAAMEQKAVRIASKVVIVTESHKFAKRSLAKFADISDVSMIVTDDKISSADVATLKRQKITLLCGNSD